MKKILTSIIALFIAHISFSQSISELAGAVKTDFEFTSLGKPMGVSDQLIVKRAEQITGSDTYGEGIGMFGVGYESFHLEFKAEIPPETIMKQLPGPLFKQYPRFDIYEIVFFGENNEEIFRAFIKTWFLNVFHDKFKDTGVYYYSMDLKDIPLIVLDNTKRIDISEPKIIRMY